MSRKFCLSSLCSRKGRALEHFSCEAHEGTVLPARVCWDACVRSRGLHCCAPLAALAAVIESLLTPPSHSPQFGSESRDLYVVVCHQCAAASLQAMAGISTDRMREEVRKLLVGVDLRSTSVGSAIDCQLHMSRPSNSAATQHQKGQTLIRREAT